MKLLLHSLALILSAAALHADWKPVESRMLTDWGRNLRPNAVWTEYPRPQFQREQWTNLNGLWSYAVSAKDAVQPKDWTGEILVPFCPESALSGVGRLIEPSEALWYRRTLPAPKPGLRSLLNFEALDYEATVWVNGKEVGTHKGGNTPFSLDVTDALKSAGENELVVRVFDATEGYQLHGKQKLQNGGIWYTRVTGIWQTVWLEEVPATHLQDLHYTCDIAVGSLTVTPLVANPEAGSKVRVTASFKGQPVGKAEGAGPLTITIPQPQLWSPTTPNLYDLKVELLNAQDAAADTVKAYTALRSYGKAKNANGNWEFTLNGKPIFHWGPLDQGWWPDGLLTPPSDAAMLSDIEFLKASGFNMIRKHIKVEPRRYYHHCDRVGIMIWQDQVSSGYGKARDVGAVSADWTRMKPDPKDADWPADAHAQWLVEYKRMVDHLRDVPSIAVWVPFNEAWGQHRTMEVGKMAAEYDRTRLINIASGGNFWPVGDVADQHQYPDPGFPTEDPRFNDYVKVAGEFGGHGLPIDGHVWNPKGESFSYGKNKPKTLQDLKDRYIQSIDALIELKKKGICGGVYTQTTDVEVEINGLRTYDRVNKLEPSWLKMQADRLVKD